MSEVEFEVTSRTPIQDGIEQFMGQGKEFVQLEAHLGDKSRNAGAYVLKHFNSREDAEKERVKHQNFREMGIPVPNTSRIFVENDQFYLAYTDLLRGEAKLASSSSDSQSWIDLALSPVEIAQIAGDCAKYMDIALKNGYLNRC